MAELIYKKSALNALSNASYGNFNYVTARNAIDCVSTTTEAEIRAKAYEEAVQKLYNLGHLHSRYLKSDIKEIAEQLKEE